jgi:malate dehydrogenase (oxaloacetate-decarboxylating)(NADP+)
MTLSSRQGTDYPNQVNNVLCFRTSQALVAGASTITIEMEIAAVHAIAELAQAEQSEVVAAAVGEKLLRPRLPDSCRLILRLMMKIAPGGSFVAAAGAPDIQNATNACRALYASGTITN